MAVIKLEERGLESIARRLARVLAEHGIVEADTADVASVERWRNAARRPGRQLGYPVRTAVSTDGTMVWAVLERPVEPGEQADAANRVATMIFGPRPFVRAYRPEE
ncbi:MAG: hypothetical protein ACYC1D_12445 [Acidimicrobiales bacterium]